MRLQTPVLLLVFNRPAQALLVLEQIRQQHPKQLFIAADGPRPGKPGEAALCDETRSILLQRIDWPCEVKTLFRPHNLGCGKAVSTAINWFFEQVEEGIILEDDCIPDASFFSFCSTLLDRYRHDEQIMHIAGSNYQMGTRRGNASYYFSRYAHIWGWASWRRAWQQYDFSLQAYTAASREGLNQQLLSDLQSVYDHKIDTWDIQWFMTVWFNKGWAVVPNINLVKNTGYGKDATHTKHTPAWFKRMAYGRMSIITHPTVYAVDEEADKFSIDTLYTPGYLPGKIKDIIKRNALLYKLYKLVSA